MTAWSDKKAKKVPGSFSLIKRMNLEPSSVAGLMKPTSLRAIQGHASERKTAGQKPRRFVAQRNNISAGSEY
jgi:hypothetical protein